MFRRILFAAYVVACGCASPPAAAASGEGAPPAGVSGSCRIVEVYDGDTVTVEFRVRARVRIVDCWSDEVRGGTPEAKARGLAARDYLARNCGMVWDDSRKPARWRSKAGTAAWLHVPFTGDGDVGSLFTMSRLVGSLWVEGESVAEQMVAAGHAYRTKAGLTAAGQKANRQVAPSN